MRVGQREREREGEREIERHEGQEKQSKKPRGQSLRFFFLKKLP